MPRLLVGALALVVLGAASPARVAAGQLTPAQVQALPPNSGATAEAEPEEHAPNSRLLRAAMAGDAAGVRTALADGADIKAASPSGATALALAAVHGHTALVNQLIAAGADVSKADQAGVTPLAGAASEGHVTVIEALAAKGADLNAPDEEGTTPLIAAASANRLATMRVLVARGAKVDATNKGGATALMAAAFSGYPDAVRLLTTRGANVNAKDSIARTPLMAAARAGSLPTIQALLEAKADVNAEDAGGSTALTFAAVGLHTALIEPLEKAGVKKGGETGFIFAAGKCGTDMVKMLVARGIGVRVERNGTNAMVLAATAECEDTLGYLIAVGGDVNAKNSEGVTPLMAAASTGNVAVVQLLLSAGADLDVTTPDGDSAWIRAALGNFPEIADLFRKVRESKR